MRIKDLDLEIVSVNYRTPDFIKRLVKSIRRYSKDVPIRIIDGSEPNWYNYNCNLDNLKLPLSFNLERMGYNIHHGPGMDYALKNTKKEWLLFLDSDIELKSNIFEFDIKNNKSFIGQLCYVNSGGMSPRSNKNINHKLYSYLYPHPRCMLVKTEDYFKYRPFKKHGAPCIDTWVDVNNKDVELIDLVDFIELGYVTTGSRGTRNRWGINLH